MAKILVVYYSRTGHTRSVAMEVAARCDADVEEIRDIKTKRHGPFGYFRCAREALGKRLPPIEPATADATSYDLVILGTPVWASHMASPMRSYLQANAGKLACVGSFCTQGGSGGPKVLAELADLAGKRALATLLLNESDIKKGHYTERLDAFVAALRNELNRRVAAPH